MNEIQKANSFFLIGKIFFLCQKANSLSIQANTFFSSTTGAEGFTAEGSSGGNPSFRLLSACKDINNSLKNNRNCLTTYYKKQFTEMDNGAFWELLLPNEIIAVSVPFFYLGKGLFNPINAKFKQNGNPLLAHLFELLNTYTTK